MTNKNECAGVPPCPVCGKQCTKLIGKHMFDTHTDIETSYYCFACNTPVNACRTQNPPTKKYTKADLRRMSAPELDSAIRDAHSAQSPVVDEDTCPQCLGNKLRRIAQAARIPEGVVKSKEETAHQEKGRKMTDTETKPMSEVDEGAFEALMDAESYCYNQALPFTAARAYDAIRPYITQRQVDLEVCVEAIMNEQCVHDEDAAICYAKAVLDAAGVPYTEKGVR